MLTRRAVLAGLLLLTGSLGGAPVPAAGTNPIAPGGPDLQTTLEKGLRARRPVEFQFIRHVIAMVDDGTLPQSLVETVFLWARGKKPYPFPYFQQALKIRAQQMGIVL